MTLDLAPILAEFVKVHELGVKADEFLAGWATAHPSAAGDIQVVRDAIAQATSLDTLPVVVGEALAGGFKAIVDRHGEVGKGDPSFG